MFAVSIFEMRVCVHVVEWTSVTYPYVSAHTMEFLYVMWGW